MEQTHDEPVVERRAQPRHAIDAAATLVVVNQGAGFSARILDLSLEGCALRTDWPQSFAAPLPVEISFKLNGIAFRFAGVMERTDGQCMAGVRFGAMPFRRREVLIEVLMELEAEQAARSAEAPTDAKSAAMGVNALPISDKAAERPVEIVPAKLVAFPFANPGPAARPGAAPETSPTPVNPKEPRGAERRAQRRHSVDTRAVIYFIDVAATAPGRILDLSLSGCRIRTDERFPSGIYRRVETEFRVAGLPFRLGGVVQSLHDRHTVGIRFLDLSERKRGQLCELMDEIAEAQQEGISEVGPSQVSCAAQTPSPGGS